MRAKPLVLIVDDENSFIEIMSAKLEAMGYETDQASNAKEAVMKAKELIPDLIIMDIYMPPGPNGVETALEIHHMPECEHVKIAFWSSLKDPWPAMSGEKAAIAQELGMEDFFEKTQDLNITAEKIKALLVPIKNS